MTMDEYESIIYGELCSLLGATKGQAIYCKIDNRLWDSLRLEHDQHCHETGFNVNDLAYRIAKRLRDMFKEGPDEEKVVFTKDITDRLTRIKDGYLDMAIANPQVAEDMKFLADALLNKKADIYFDLLPVPKEPEPVKPPVPKKDFYKTFTVTILSFLAVVGVISLIVLL